MPAELIVRHVLSVTPGGDWPIQRDMLEAVLRRCASTHTDEIQIVGRPRNRLLGLYATRRRGSRAHPYRTLLRRSEPLDGSCDCADSLRNSLGLCKHLVAVLEDLVSKRRRVDIEREMVVAPAPLRWDPIRPLTGLGDWLARVRWVDGVPDRSLRPWLRSTKGHGWTVSIPAGPRERLTFVDRLLGVLSDGHNEPALHALLHKERGRLGRQVQTASTRTRLDRALHTLKQSLYPYQREGVDRFFSSARLLLADDNGSRQDRAGDCRLPRALAYRPRPPRSHRCPRRAQAAVARRLRPAVIVALGLILDPWFGRFRFRWWRRVPDPGREFRDTPRPLIEGGLAPARHSTNVRGPARSPGARDRPRRAADEPSGSRRGPPPSATGHLRVPNIAHIHGFEESSSTPALIMELVEGATLADRLARGAMPVDEALHVARQIADALDAAHERGIIHRDLKPANIKVTPAGLVKVLDFGLAKAIDASGAEHPSGHGAENSPTMTSPAVMSRTGVILGTAAYMSPEQAKGAMVDKRADIWAVGGKRRAIRAGTAPQCFRIGGDRRRNDLYRDVTIQPCVACAIDLPHFRRLQAVPGSCTAPAMARRRGTSERMIDDQLIRSQR